MRRGGIVVVLVMVSGCAATTTLRPVQPTFGDGTVCVDSRPRHYRVGVVLDPVHRRLRATVAIEISCLPKDGISFFLNPHLFLERALVNDKRVATSEETAVGPEGTTTARHRAHYRGQSREPAVLELRYEGKLRNTGTPLNEVSADLVELSRHSIWYPRFASTALFTADLSVYAPARFRIVALGRSSASLSVTDSKGAALREWNWSMEIPSADLVVIGAPHLRSLEVADRGQKISSYYSTLPSQLVEVVTATLAQTRSFLEQTLGEGVDEDTSTLVFVPRTGPGYRSSSMLVRSEEAVRTSSDTVELLAHESSARWWAVNDSPGAPLGEERALADYYAERATGQVPTSAEGGATGALLRAIEQRVGRDALDQVLRRLRSAAPERPMSASTLNGALRAGFGDVLVDAAGRPPAGGSDAQPVDQKAQPDEHQAEQ